MAQSQDLDREYEEAYSFICSLDRFGILLGLENITSLLSDIGSPQEKFPAIHIAGSKGKGSTAAFLNSILLQANIKTALYTSPHLNDFRERIRINGKMISKEEVIESMKKVKAVYNPSRTTYFEFTTALAFDCIAKHQPRLAIVEVGLGGRLDATNLVNPLVSIITDISREHEDYLGEGLYAIAKEKAGIIKEGVPVVTSASREESLRAILETVAARSAGIKIFGRDFRGFPASLGAFDYQSARVTMKELEYSLAGLHQIRNASLAIAAVEEIRRNGFFIPEIAIRKGLAQAFFPARFELVSRNPDIIIDAAHTLESIEFLIKTMNARYPNKRPILLLGMLKEKNYPMMLKALRPIAERVVCVKPQGDRALEAQELARAAGDAGMEATAAHTIEDGLVAVKDMASEDDLILVTGSLYMLGPVRRACGLEDE
jgi:dihydrofolate synthase/folylpolyglutamate synthase